MTTGGEEKHSTDLILRSMHSKQRFVVAEEGIRSNDSFLCISNDSTAD